MSSKDDDRLSEVVPYASPPQQARPNFARFAFPAIVSVAVGLMLARAGNLGKLDYDWRAGLGIALVACGIVTYIVGRAVCKRPSGGAS